jgi:hypothetical protein
MKRVAATDSLDGQPTATQGPIAVDGFISIFRTGGLETTCRRKRSREGPLIKADYPQQDGLHSSFSSDIGISGV